MEERYVSRVEGQKTLRDLDCEPISSMQFATTEWWRHPSEGKFPVQLHGGERLYYRVQLDNIPSGLERSRAARN